MQGLDILVNSAGVFQPASIEETDEALWNRIMDIKSEAVISVHEQP